MDSNTTWTEPTAASSSRASPLVPGSTVARYLLLGLLGAGGMGVVYAAYDPELDRKIALKLLLPEHAGELAATRLLREAQALARLAHPHVVTVHDAGTHGDRVWIAMEFVAGGTLGAWAQARRRAWQECVQVLTEAARGVAAAHAVGLVHRDLKPDNVMIGDDGRVRVMDFGLAHGRAVGPTAAPMATPTDTVELAATLAEPAPHDPTDAPTIAETHEPLVVPLAAAPTLAAELGPRIVPLAAAPTLAAELGPRTATLAAARTLAAELVPPTATLAAAATLAAKLEPRVASRVAESGPHVQRAGASPLALRLTRAGAIQGTPAYMAPEQWLGGECGATADQFSWCVMAWELLYGETPFAGESLAELAHHVTAGLRRRPPAQARVPTWLRRVLERGLAASPEARWPSMEALLEAIRRVGVGVAVLAVSLAGLEGARRWDQAQRTEACIAAGDEVAAVWSAETHDAVRTAFLATGVSHAESTAERIVPWLERQAVDGAAARTEACMQTEVHGRWDEATAERASWCLDEQRTTLASLVAEFARADASTVQQAVRAVASLRPAAACLDVARLGRLPSPPASAREVVQELRAALARAGALGLAGRFNEGIAVVDEVRPRADALAWAPLTAAAAVVEGRLRSSAADYGRSAEALSTAYFTAATVSEWEVAADAASQLVYTVGYKLARHEDGHGWARHAEVALAHTGDIGGLREADRLASLASVHFAAGDYREALKHDEGALAIRERVLGADHPLVASSLGNIAGAHLALGDYKQAQALYEQTITAESRALGREHPRVAMQLSNLAGTYSMLGDFKQARDLHEHALAIRERALGPDHPDVADSLMNLAYSLDALGDAAAARPLHARALAIREQKFGPEHPLVAQSLNNLAVALASGGQYAEAESLHARALAIREKALGPEHADVALSLANLALSRRRAGDRAGARALQERARGIFEKALGREHPWVAESLLALADLDLDDGSPRRAVAMIEQAIAILAAHEGEQTGEFQAQFRLARALVAAGDDRARAIAAAERARDGLRPGGDAPQLAEIESWLAAERGRPGTRRRQ